MPVSQILDQIRQQQAQQQEAKTGMSAIDTQVASLAGHGGWEQVEKFIQSRIQATDTALEGALANGADFEAIGMRYTVAAIVKAELESIISYVRMREQYVAENQKDQTNPTSA